MSAYCQESFLLYSIVAAKLLLYNGPGNCICIKLSSVTTGLNTTGTFILSIESFFSASLSRIILASLTYILFTQQFYYASFPRQVRSTTPTNFKELFFPFTSYHWVLPVFRCALYPFFEVRRRIKLSFFQRIKQTKVSRFISLFYLLLYFSEIVCLYLLLFYFFSFAISV